MWYRAYKRRSRCLLMTVRLRLVVIIDAWCQSWLLSLGPIWALLRASFFKKKSYLGVILSGPRVTNPPPELLRKQLVICICIRVSPRRPFAKMKGSECLLHLHAKTDHSSIRC